MAVRKAAGLLGGGNSLPETFGYSVKRRLLGPPLVNDQLGEERLSKPLALGVLSCDGISSANYGSELILHELLPFFGLDRVHDPAADDGGDPARHRAGRAVLPRGGDRSTRGPADRTWWPGRTSAPGWPRSPPSR